jgi:hypothetical protein
MALHGTRGRHSERTAPWTLTHSMTGLRGCGTPGSLNPLCATAQVPCLLSQPKQVSLIVGVEVRRVASKIDGGRPSLPPAPQSLMAAALPRFLNAALPRENTVRRVSLSILGRLGCQLKKTRQISVYSVSVSIDADAAR